MADFDILERYDVRFPGMADIIVAAYNEQHAIDIAAEHAAVPNSFIEQARIVYHAALD